MFKVSNTVPGFRVGTVNDEPGFRIQDFASSSKSYEMPLPGGLLAGNPYLRIANNPRDIDTWGASDAASAFPFGSGAMPSVFPPRTRSAWVSPTVAGGLQSASAVDAQELCRGVGRAGPYCLYQCPNGDWVSSPLYPTGPCPPFIVPGIGTSPWEGPANSR
jgi:hypothetical protein